MEKAFNLSAYFYAFSIALFPFLSSVALGVFIAASIFLLIKEKKWFGESIHGGLLLFSVLFFMYVIYVPFSLEINRGFKIISRILPIVVIPILISIPRIANKLKRLNISVAFILGVTLSCLVSLLLALITFFKTGNDFSSFFYYNLSSYMHLHPTYYSLYILCAIILLKDDTLPLITLRFKLSIALLFTIFLILLETKMAILIFFLLISIFLIKSFGNWKGIFAVALLFSLVLGITYSTNYNLRVKELFKDRESLNIGNFEEDGVSQRIWLWTKTVDQIKEKPLLGYGVESQKTIFRWKIEKELLKDELVDFSFAEAAKRIATKNLHNQYLQILYEFGLVGLFLFLISVLFLFFLALKRKNYVFLSVYIIFLLFLITENLLYRQMGIYFYSFMLPYLFIKHNTLKVNIG
ncbi:O-antigen ligase family protein [Aquimarina rubra]|uniref:O-antigen ligase family protein n=1 Tax=Aquimarina rubra TaxID=1920033 RepID=A0ABW5LIB7_9FLAO